MSGATAVVLFPTGHVRYTIYEGSSDTLVNALSATLDEAWDRRRGDWWDRDPGLPPGTGAPVLVCSHYGGGTWWQATATPTWLTSAREYGDWPPNPWAPPETWPTHVDPYRGIPNYPMPPYWNGVPPWADWALHR